MKNTNSIIRMMVVLAFLGISCQRNEAIVNPKGDKAEHIENIGFTKSTSEILQAARSIVPIDTTERFAYGVLDKGKSKNKVWVGYFNSKVFEIYEFNLVNRRWKMGDMQSRESMRQYRKMNNIPTIKDYHGKIADIYSGNQLRDT